MKTKIQNKKTFNTKNNSANNKKTIGAILTGIIAGLINGIFGGGGGMVVVPLLTHILDLPPQNAHATALLIILPLSIVSGLFYAAFGTFNLNVGVPVLIGVSLGGAVGALLLKKISSKWLVIIFSLVMIFAGARMLFF